MLYTFISPILNGDLLQSHFFIENNKMWRLQIFFFKIILKTAVVFQGCRQTNWELIYPCSFASKIDHFAGACFPKRLNLLWGGLKIEIPLFLCQAERNPVMTARYMWSSFMVVFDDYSQRWRWIVVGICRAAKRPGKYPPLSPTPRWIILLF